MGTACAAGCDWRKTHGQAARSLTAPAPNASMSTLVIELFCLDRAFRDVDPLRFRGMDQAEMRASQARWAELVNSLDAVKR